MTTFVIAGNTLGEALRKKILWIFFIAAAAMIVLSVSFSQFSFRGEMTIIRSLGLGLLSIVGLLITLVLGINLISVEMERKTIYTILSKPVRRYEFLLGKFLGAMMTLLIQLLLMSTVFIFLVTWKSNWDWKGSIELLKGTVMIFFQLLMVGSVAMVFSVFTTPVVNFFTTSAIYIVGNLDLTDPMMHSKLALQKMFYTALHYAIPNFSNYNIQNKLIHPEVAITGEFNYYAINVAYAVLYSSVLLIIAVLAFEKRDM